MVLSKIRRVNKNKIHFVLLSLIFSISGVQPLFSQSGGIIKGRVLNSDGFPISGLHAILMPTGEGDVTDQNGMFKFENIKPGFYSVKLNHIAYEPQIVSNIQLDNHQTLNLDTIFLQNRIIEMEGVVVSATRTNRTPTEVSQAINYVNSKQVIERNANNPAEALREETGVFVQKTGHGGGSAIIRGLGSNQILLLVDGIRLNNSTYRLGNHPYLTTVDKHIVQQIEVVRGPASVLYGSDALGGTVNLITRVPSLLFENLKLHYTLQSIYRSADETKGARGELSLHSGKYYFRTGLSVNDYGDLRRGSNSSEPVLENSTNGLVQTPSGFQSYDIDAQMAYLLSSYQSVILAYQKSHKKDIPRYDKYENDNYYKWLYAPLSRDLVYLTYENRQTGKIIQSVKTSLSLHWQDEGRKIQETEQSPLTEESNRVLTTGLTLQMHSAIRNHNLTFGTDIYLDRVDSDRWLVDVVSGDREKDVRGRYPDGAKYNSWGFYLQDEFRSFKKLTLIPALRYSLIRTVFTMPSDIAEPLGVSQNFQSIAGSFGLIYQTSDYLFLNFNLGQAFRAPNLSDMSKLGESKGNTYEVPNTNLEPEKMVSVDLGLKYDSKLFDADFSVYYASISDLLASAGAEWEGQSTIEIGGTEYIVKSKQNIGEAFIRGFESNVRWRLSSDFSMHANLTSTYGQNLTADEPVGGIPPLFGLVGLRWDFTPVNLGLFIRFAGKQDRLSADDLDDPRIPPGGTPGWWTLNFRSAIAVKNVGTFRFAVENILDINYREHGSGINGPGRNFIIGFEVKK